MKLLDEYKGQKVTMKTATGFVTFDTTKVPETDYPAYHALGFDFCFEPLEPTYKKPIAYKGIEQEGKDNNSQQNKNAKKVKTKTKEA